MMAWRPNTLMRFLSTPFLASKIFPCQAKWLMKAAMSGVKAEPAATMAVPSASPSGISPAGVLVNSSSSWAWLIFRSWGTSYAMVSLLWGDDYRGARAASARMASAAFSPTMYTALAMKKPGMRGNTEASTTRSPAVLSRTDGAGAGGMVSPCVPPRELTDLLVGLHGLARNLLRADQVVLLDTPGDAPHELHRLHEGVEVLAGVVAAFIEVAEVDARGVAGNIDRKSVV